MCLNVFKIIKGLSLLKNIEQKFYRNKERFTVSNKSLTKRQKHCISN